MPVSIQLSKIVVLASKSAEVNPVPGVPPFATRMDDVDFCSLIGCFFGFDMVGLGRFELPTSPLSGVRSNQLSYRPLIRGKLVELNGIEPMTS